jgi:hypothetical protein
MVYASIGFGGYSTKDHPCMGDNRMFSDSG